MPKKWYEANIPGISRVDTPTQADLRDQVIDRVARQAAEYANLGAEQSNEVASLALSAVPNSPDKGDVASLTRQGVYDATMAKGAVIDLMRKWGMFNTREYATNPYYVTLPQTAFLESLLPTLQGEYDQSVIADEEAANNRAATAETASSWIELFKNKDASSEFDQWHNLLMADYLLGDRSELFDFEKINAKYEEMDDDAYYAELDRLQKQYDSLDWETLTGSKSNKYESKTDELKGQIATLEKELSNRQVAEALEAEALAAEDFGQFTSYEFISPEYTRASDPLKHTYVQGLDNPYNFINSDATWSEKNVASEHSLAVKNYLDEGYDYLYPEEVKVYSYYYKSGQYDKAQAYLDAKRSALLARRADANEAWASTKATNGLLAVPSFINAAISGIGNILYTPAQFIETAMGRGDPNSSEYDMLNKKGYINTAQIGDIQDSDMPEWLKGIAVNAYGAASSALDNVGRLAAAGFNPSVALIFAGLQSASYSLHESTTRDDMSNAAKIIKALGTGAIEIGTEKIGLDALFAKGKNGALNYIKNVLLSELGEESINYISEDVLESVVAFLFEYEADIKSGPEFWQGLTDTWLQTALSSLMVSGGESLRRGAANRSTGKNIAKNGDLDAMLRFGSELATDSSAYQIAEKIKATLDAGKKVRLGRWGELSHAIEETIGEEYAKTTNEIAEKAVEERLIELGSTPEAARQNAPVVRKLATGGKITMAERASLLWDDNATQVVKEMANDIRTTENVVPGAVEGTEAQLEDGTWVAGDADVAETNRTGKQWVSSMEGKLQEAIRDYSEKKLRFSRYTYTDQTGKSAKAAGEKAKTTYTTDKKLPPKAIAYEHEGATGEGTVDRLEKAEDGTFNVVVTSDDKTVSTVPVADVRSVGTEGVGAILAYIDNTDEKNKHRDLTAAEANNMLHVYETVGGNATDFIQDYESSYLYGYAGIENKPLTTNSKVAEIAYNFGMEDAKADESNRAKVAGKAGTGEATWVGKVTSSNQIGETQVSETLEEAIRHMTEAQQVTVRVAQALAKKMKVDVAFFESDAEHMGEIENGSFIPGTNQIYIDINSGVSTQEALTEQKKHNTLGFAILRTLAHELTHYMENNSNEGYAAYKQAVKDALKAKNVDWAKLVRAKIDTAIKYGQKLTIQGAEAEVIADASEYMLQDSKFIKGLDTDTVGKIKTFIQDFMARIRDAFRNLMGSHVESYVLRDVYDGIKKYSQQLQDLWDAGMELAVERVQGTVGSVDDSAYKTGEIYGYEPQNSIRVRDDETIAFLENQKHITTYRAMQVVDGELYPPMAEFIGSKKDGNREDSSSIGSWEMATEHPELIKWVNGKPKFELKKVNDDGSVSTVPAAYNPYMHSSNTVLNDQFSKAFQRNNLVVVECVVPVSESNGAYHAEYAKDSTGWHEWKSGIVAGDLAKQKSGFRRDVFLSRYIKPVRILPDTEVAEKIAGYLDGTDVTIPFQSAWPTLRDALVKAGVSVTEPRGLGPAQMKIAKEAFDEWKSGHGGSVTIDAIAAQYSLRGSAVTEEDVRAALKWCSLLNAKGDDSYDGNFVPVRTNTPLYILEYFTSPDAQMVMNVGKVRQALSADGKPFGESKGHGFSAQELAEIMWKTSSPEFFSYSSVRGNCGIVVEHNGAGVVVVVAPPRHMNADLLLSEHGGFRTVTVTMFAKKTVDDAIIYLEDDGYIEKPLPAEAEGDLAPVRTEGAVTDNVPQQEETVNTSSQKSIRDDESSPDGIEIDPEDGSAYRQYSIRTWDASDYVQKRDEMVYRLVKTLGVSKNKAKKWINDVNSVSAIILGDKLRLDYTPTAVEGATAFKSNPEYGGSIDMSTICAKRRLATGTLDAIQERLGDAVLTKDDFLRIREVMKERNYEVACGLCFVESSRKNLAKYTAQFLAEFNASHPGNQVSMTDFNTVDGLERTRVSNKEAYAAYEKFMNKLAQRKPKLFEKRTEYQHEILKKFKKDTTVSIKNLNGGLRLQSFSDFEIVHLIDMMQVITDMASVGLAGQAYTKVPDFAWALGDTGLKINLSLISKGVDADGNLIFDDVEGMNHEDARKLRERYSKNVGTIVVTFTDEQLIAAMKNDMVDYIIPFHRSQWQKSDYKLLGLPDNTKDYTMHQNEKEGGKRVKENFLPNAYWDFSLSGKENAEKYLAMCNAAGRTPKFAKFLHKNSDGTYILQEDGSTDGYWKLLIDFKMYDNNGVGSPQLPVVPDFNMKQAKRMLNEYTGEHDTFPVAEDVVEDFVKEYTDRKGGVKSAGGKFTVQGAQLSLRDLPDDLSVREYLMDADESVAATIEEKNALTIYQQRLREHAAASEAVMAAEAALVGKTGEDLKNAQVAIATASARQKELYNRLIKVENTEHIQKVFDRSVGFIREEIAGKTQNQIANTIANREAKINTLTAELAGLKGAAKTQKEADIRAQERIVRQLKSDAARKMLAMSERYQQAADEIRTRRDMNLEIAKKAKHIKGVIKRLNDRIIHEGDYKNVKEDLKPAVHSVVRAFIDGFGSLVFDSTQSDNLRRVYDLLAKDGNESEWAYSDDVARWIDELAALSAQDKERRMSGGSSMESVAEKLETYEKLVNIADHIYHLVKSADEMFVNGKKEQFSQYSAEVGNELIKRKDKGLYVGAAGKTLDVMDDLIHRGNMIPVYFFESLKNNGLKRLYDNLMDGQRKYAEAILAGKRFVAEAQNKYNYYTWSRKHQTFKTQQGHTIALTVEQKMWVYATAKREAANELAQTHHLDQGGFRYGKDSLPKANAFKAIEGSEDFHKLNAKDVAMITDTLTAEQKAYADTLVEFLSDDMAEYGNRASMELFGIKKYNEKYYFPFKTASDQRHQSSAAGSASTTDDARVKHSSFTHALIKGANTGLVMGNFTDVVANHINLMSTYSSFVVPIESLNRVLNRKVNTMEDGSGNDVTIRSLIGRKYGDAAQKYIADLLKDMNGGPQVDNRGGLSGLMRIFKRSAVVGSLSVAVQQPTAYIRAFAYISPKYFTHFTGEGYKATWDKMMKYSGTAVIKDMGRFDVGMGKMADEWIANGGMEGYNVFQRGKFLLDEKGKKAMVDNYVDFMTALPGVLDQVTWTHLWKAVEAEQADLHPDMNRNSEEFLLAVGERFDDVVNHTQVYDSILSKSQNMRSKNLAAQMSTAFMAEPTLNANMYYSAITGGHSKAQAAKMINATVLANVAAAALATLINAWNKDDDERKGLEKYMATFSSRLIDNLNPLTMVPYLSDLYDIFTGYEPERLDLSVLVDLVNYSNSFYSKVVEGKEITWRDYENFVGSWANLAGVPAKNVSRDLRRFVNFLNTDHSLPTASSLKYTLYEEIAPDAIWASSGKAYCQRFVAAIADGDTREAYDLWEYMNGTKGVSQSSLETNIRAALKEAVQNGTLTPTKATEVLRKYVPYKNDKDNQNKPQEWLKETK